MSDDRKASRQIVSDTVRMLIIDLVNEDPEVGKTAYTRLYNKKLREMAGYLGINQDYMPVKMKRGHWGLDDLDKLADFFDMEPADFLPGHRHTTHRERKHD